MWCIWLRVAVASTSQKSFCDTPIEKLSREDLANDEKHMEITRLDWLYYMCNYMASGGTISVHIEGSYYFFLGFWSWGKFGDQPFYKMMNIHVEQWLLIGQFFGWYVYAPVHCFMSQIWQPASSTPLLTPQLAHNIVSRVCSGSRVSLCYFWKQH